MKKKKAETARSWIDSRWAASAFVAIALCLYPATALCHGAIGNRGFLSPVIGNDAFPDNAFTVASRVSGSEFSLLAALEKELTDRSSILITGGWDEFEPKAKPDVSGAEDLSIYLRQALYISVEHELELTVSPFVVVPIGSRQIADHGFTHLGGELLAAKGLGDLPQSGALQYLRPLALQCEAGYAGSIEGPAHNDVVANLEAEYSLRYLDTFVWRLNLEQPWVDLVPYVQFNYSQSLTTSRLTTRPDFHLTPGIAYLSDYFEISVGTQIALNGPAETGDRVAAIGLVEIFYDNIVPALGRNPF